VNWITKTGIVLVVATALLLPSCSSPHFNNLSDELDYMIHQSVNQDGSVRNCVLSVTKGDGSFSWSGAAGIARQDGQAPMTKDTPIYIASVTKLYTATVIMRLAEKGALSLDDPISKYLPEQLIYRIHVYNGKDYSREITIRQLLSHTSGIADYYAEKPNGGKTVFELLMENPERPWTPEETIKRARDDLKPNFPPGADVAYSDTNFQLLGKIVESITGKPLHTAFEEFIFRPLNLRHTWLIGHSDPAVTESDAPADVFYKSLNITRSRSNGAYWADGGIVSTPSEMIVFLKALNEGRIIKPETLKLMHNWRKWRFPLQYGYGTMYFKLPWFVNMVMGVPPLWGHSGSTGSFLYYSEDLKLYIAGSLNQADSPSKPFRLMGKVIHAVQSKTP